VPPPQRLDLEESATYDDDVPRPGHYLLDHGANLKDLILKRTLLRAKPRALAAAEEGRGAARKEREDRPAYAGIGGIGVVEGKITRLSQPGMKRRQDTNLPANKWWTTCSSKLPATPQNLCSFDLFEMAAFFSGSTKT